LPMPDLTSPVRWAVSELRLTLVQYTLNISTIQCLPWHLNVLSGYFRPAS